MLEQTDANGPASVANGHQDPPLLPRYLAAGQRARAHGIDVKVRLPPGRNSAASSAVWTLGAGQKAWHETMDEFRCWAINGIPCPDPKLGRNDQETAFCDRCWSLVWTKDMEFNSERGGWLCRREPEHGREPFIDNSGAMP